MAAISKDLLTHFQSWADVYRKSLLMDADSAPEISEDVETIQGDVFWEDLRRGVESAGRASVYEAATALQALAVFPLSLIAPFGEMCRFASGTISFSTCLSHVFTLPKHAFFAILEIIGFVGRSLGEVWTGAEAGMGFLVWHSGEWVVRQVTCCSSSVLSQVPAARSFVYTSIGSPLLALGGIFIPSASVQVMALTVLSLQIYEIASHSLGIRDCPAYYTINRAYEGDKFKG